MYCVCLRKIAAVAGLSAAWLFVLPAWAEAPMNVDDAGTLALGAMKFEGTLSRDDKTRGGELLFGFAPMENVEISLALTRAKDHDEAPSTRISGTGVGIKWVPIQNETGFSLGWSLAYGHERIRYRVADERHVAKELALAGLLTYRFENGQVLHANLGGERVKEKGEKDNLATWGMGYEWPLTHKLRLTFEVFGEEKSRPDKAIGLRYELFEGFKLSGALGSGNDRSFGQVGFAWEF